MPYVGNDWSDLSPGENRLLSIDLSPYIQTGDALVPSSIAVEFHPVIGDVPNYTALLDGIPYLVGNIANQAINEPPAARYLLGFTCSTTSNRIIELWSYFWSKAEPISST